MKTTLKQLDEIKGSLTKLILAPGIPPRVAYRATKFSKKVAKEITELEEARLVLVKKYGVDDGKGVLRVLPKNMGVFERDYGEVLKEEVELPDIQIRIDDLTNAGLSMLDFANLDFMLVEEDPTEQKK